MNKKLKKSDLSENNIILLDSSFQSNELKKLDQKADKIITFDYESHKRLLTNEIPHEISDDYLTKQDLVDIQNRSYDFVKWYGDLTVSGFLDYEGVNLGRLFYWEFHTYLVPFLKKFLESRRIYEKYPQVKFIARGDLYRIFSSFTTSAILFKTNDSYSYISPSPSLKYNLTIGRQHFTISLPQNVFTKLKFFVEIFIHILFSQINNNDKKNVLLIDFSPTRYKRFFLQIPESNLNIFLHNRLIPSVWDFESYTIIKKSKCIVTTIYDLLDRKVKHSIKLGIKNIDLRSKSMWKHNDFFQSFFSLNDVSFWPIIKPIFINMFEKRIREYINEIELTKKLLNKYRFSSILIWSENGVNEQIAISLAKKLQIKTALIQHGLYDDIIEAYNYNKLGNMPIYSNKFLVWGEIFKKYAITCGIPKEKIEIIGSPLYDNFFLNKKEFYENSFILFATTNPSKNSIYDLTFDSLLRREQVIEKICTTVSKLNKRLIIKLHPSPYEIDITDFVHKIDPKIAVVKAGNILELAKNCAVFITFDTSTTILESQICNKPVISISVYDRGYGDSEVFKSKSCIKINIDEFEETLNKLLSDNVFRTNTLLNARQFVNNYLSNQGTASEHLLSFLEKL